LQPHKTILSGNKLASDGYQTGDLIADQAGNRLYELTNHLGNVLATINDAPNPAGTTPNHNVMSAQDYYPFGMAMPGRSYIAGSSLNYRYGFNGKENDNEVEGVGNQIDYGMRVYDPRIGKFLSVDPLQKKYPWYTPYQYAGNKPISSIDVDGLEDHWTADGRHYQGPVTLQQTTGQELFTHPPTFENPIITYSRGQVTRENPNPAYQYTLWTGGTGVLGPFRLTPHNATDALFKEGFNFYLPRRFIDHYELAGGQPYQMTRKETDDVHMSPFGIQGHNTEEGARFFKAIEGLKVGGTRDVKNWTIITGAYTSGTLGNFYATVNGTITGVQNQDGSTGWRFEGTLQMNDYWDFDPANRNWLAENLVRVANKWLPGTPFWIHSAIVPANQTSQNEILDYPENYSIIPNRVASEVVNETKTGDANKKTGKPN
jgi:RHS repeat-associated protein